MQYLVVYFDGVEDQVEDFEDFEIARNNAYARAQTYKTHATVSQVLYTASAPPRAARAD